MYREYLREHHPIRFDDLCLTGELWTYLADLNEQAQSRLEVIIEQMKDSEGVTEALKAADQMAWVGSMNSIRNRAEKIVLAELIYEEDEVCESLKNFDTAILSQQSITHLLAKNIKSCWS